ncbi:YaaR family protein [Caloramator sp. ALD01]|uniref:YaaR family protein n=1 Tax=Caloramator sp. ALD01 TaxID=1031288 RepID=UPI00041C517D|nr:YaaR family protein [Caloramator sp. ALD01]
MRVNRINRTNSAETKQVAKTSVSSSFSAALDLANKDQTEQNLQNMLNEIDKLGKKLIATRSVEDAREYRKKVQEYLNYVVKNAYILKREVGPYSYGLHIKIEIINEKVDAITRELIEQQRETIELADKIEEIKGLLVDVYK